MQTTFSSSRILLPVRPWFILVSLLCALLINFLPTANWFWMPDFVALVLIFWCIREPRHLGMGSAFLLGMLMDVADASLMGQHSLAYVLTAYAASTLARRILWFPLERQALHVLPLLLLVQLVQAGVGLVSGGSGPDWLYFVSPFLGTCLWLPLTFVLLLPQYQPYEHDANRPI